MHAEEQQAEDEQDQEEADAMPGVLADDGVVMASLSLLRRQQQPISVNTRPQTTTHCS
jgi:hypothetical protein